MARHKEFEPEHALNEAMLLFWEQGYDNTSMQDLVARMGVHKRSMYDTFGDKRSLYLQALQRYSDALDVVYRETAEAIGSPRKTIRALFEYTLEQGAKDSRGCLLVNCATELGHRDPEAAALVERSFSTLRQVLHDLIAEGQLTGEITRRQDADALADLLLTAWIGLRAQARTGVGPDRLRDTADNLLAALD